MIYLPPTLNPNPASTPYSVIDLSLGILHSCYSCPLPCYVHKQSNKTKVENGIKVCKLLLVNICKINRLCIPTDLQKNNYRYHYKSYLNGKLFKIRKICSRSGIEFVIQGNTFETSDRFERLEFKSSARRSRYGMNGRNDIICCIEHQVL